MSTQSPELFRSPRIVVRARQDRKGGVCVVTFDSYSDIRALPRPAFAEEFLASLGVDGIHVQAIENDWYHYAELPEALAAIKQAVAGYDKVFAYGSSMGGFAAIRFAGAFGASAAIAISPQYSINPAIAPWEVRWAYDSQRIRFVLDDPEYAAWAPHAVVFYDPIDTDRRHVDMFEQRTSIDRVGLAYSGHPCSGFLNDTRLLKSAIEDILHGRFDRTAFIAGTKAARVRSPHYFRELSSRGRSADRAIRFAHRALDLMPGSALTRSHLAQVLTRHGHFEEACEQHRAAIASAPNNPVLIYRYSETLEQAGDIAGALTQMKALMASEQAAENYRPRLKHLRRRLMSESVLGYFKPRPGMAAPKPDSARDRIRDLAQRALSAGRSKLSPIRGAIGARSGDVSDLPLDQRVTLTPAPPPMRHAWQRHLDILAARPTRAVDLLLLGDSHAHYWPEDLWKPWRVYNAGVLADKTQHTLWRLEEMAAAGKPIEARFVLVVLGTNNLGADDTPAGIAAGLATVAARAQDLAPAACVAVLELPPCGPGFGFRATDRKAANALLRSNRPTKTISAEAVLTSGPRAYRDDDIHFSDEGYRRLTAHVRSALEDLADGKPTPA